MEVVEFIYSSNVCKAIFATPNMLENLLDIKHCDKS